MYIYETDIISDVCSICMASIFWGLGEGYRVRVKGLGLRVNPKPRGKLIIIIIYVKRACASAWINGDTDAHIAATEQEDI